MKKIVLISLLFLTNLSNSQITIDSFAVYNSGFVIDSFYVKTTSQGQILSNISLPSTLDICATLYARAFFIGCETGIPVTKDTMITYGFYCKKMFFSTFWDTSYTCPLPIQTTYMDCVVWNQCDNWGLEEEILQQNFSFYPNPTKGKIVLRNSNEVEILSISLLDQFGRKVKQYAKHEETFDLSELETGLFFFEIETPRGKIIKRVFLL